MWQIFVAIQYIGIAILIAGVLYLFKQRPSKFRIMLMTIFLAVLVNFVGYLMELTATEKDVALQAVKFTYLGKPYVILCNFLFVLEYFHVRISELIKKLLIVFHISITFLVFTCEHQKLYYTSIRFVDTGAFPHLEMGHGVFYITFMLGVVVYFIILLFVGVQKLFVVKSKAERRKIYYMMLIPLVCSASLLAFITGITAGYDSTMPAYLFSALILLFLTNKYNLLDTMEIAKENMIDEYAAGLFVFDEEEGLVFKNPQADLIYHSVTLGENAELYEELNDYAISKNRLHKNGQVYRVIKKEIERNAKSYGYMFVVDNVTELYNYTIDLEKQTKIAKQANRAKSDFLAKMSHEIRTPINAVIGMNEMILRESNEDNIRAYAVDVKSSANALLSIINDILDSSKIESGKMEIIPVNFELDSLIHDVVNMVFQKAKEKGLALNVKVDKSIPNVLFGDDVRIRQVLVNLLNNAVKYTKEGSVTLEVTGSRDGEFENITFHVKDTGIGIKEEDMPRLYESFRRIEEEVNRGIEGTGLGMSIVIELLKLMDSGLKVDSRYGEGSSFRFVLRLKVISDIEIGDYEERFKEAARVSDYKTELRAPDVKILVVDDNELNRRVFKNLLKKTEIQIDAAGSGKECLERVLVKHYDIIFLDHMMPEMDGIETLERLKKLENNKCKDTPVIVLTANAITGAKERYFKKGFDDYLSKPIIPEKLEKMIMDYLPENVIASPEGYGEDEKDDKNASQKDSESKLPYVEGFDWEQSGKYLSSEELIIQTAKDTYNSLPNKIKLLEELVSKLTDDEALDKYRIEVHALKSFMATLGADALSKNALELEDAASISDIEKIHELHPAFITALTKAREGLKVFEEREQTMDFDRSEVIKLLENLETALHNEDYDETDELVEVLRDYRLEGEDKELMDELSGSVLELETEEAMEIVAKLLVK